LSSAFLPAAGSTSSCLMGQSLSERLGQQFVIDNRPGGGRNIGTEAVVRAQLDRAGKHRRPCYNAQN